LGAVYALLIHLHSQQELIYLSSPHANRDQENIEGVVGQFVNALPITIDFSGNPTFSQLVKRFTASSMELLAHTYIPFALVMKKHNLINYHLMGAEFIYHNYSLELAKLGNTDMTIVNMSADSTAYDLEMHLWETSKVNITSTAVEGIQGELFYNSNCFKTETANRFITDFYALLERVVTQPSELISNIDLLKI
jgi:non-ribosomal peptide synthetase component F